MINEEILTTLQNQEIKKGDVLLVSSDITQLILNLCGGMKNFNKKKARETGNNIIDTLQELVGESGTLLFPTYNWGWCKGETFIYEKTLGKTGALGNYALKRSDFFRTKHPIYSFAVWGKDKDFLVSLENKDSFGKDSPFEYLFKKKAKNLFIDTSDFYTFTHFVEESVGVSYRFVKSFKSKYIKNNITKECIYNMYVRDLNVNFEVNFDLLNLLENKNCLKKFKIFEITCGIIDVYTSFPIIKNDILNNSSKNIIKLL